MNVAVLVTGAQHHPTFIPLFMDHSLANAKYSVYHLQSLKKEYEYAVKIYPNDKISQMAFLREKKIVANLSHENVISYAFGIKFNEQAYQCTFLPMEYAPHGDFFDLIFSQELNNERLLRTYFHQLINAVEYIHSKNIAHLDLKLENLLLGRDYSLKVTDFDQSQVLSEKGLIYKGSPSFRAPEVLAGTCASFFPADMYSIGIILFTLATGDFPFLEKEEESGIVLAHYDLFCTSNDKFWDWRLSQKGDKSMFTEAFKEVVNGLLNPGVSKRWDMTEVKNSRWYKGETLSKEELKATMEKMMVKKGPEALEKITESINKVEIVSS